MTEVIPKAKTNQKSWRLLELLQATTKYLQQKQIDSPRLNAELLLAKVLDMDRMELYLNHDRPLLPGELRDFRRLVQRRANREPVQYILGETEFMSLRFQVNETVLIPRQDTETLVEWVVESYKDSGAIEIIDLGTGCGNIAISLAHYLPESRVMAVDVSPAAVSLARSNAEQNELKDRISFLIADIMEPDFGAEMVNRFDVIVANPPYVTKGDWNTLEPEVRQYEPRIALLDPAGGGSFFKRIAECVPRILKKEGSVFAEIGVGQAKMVQKIFEDGGLGQIEIRRDYAGTERVVKGRYRGV